MKKNLIVVLLFSVAFLSCEKVIDFDIPEADPLLVVNGYITDAPGSISLSSSLSYLEPDEELPKVSGADLVLYKNGSQVSTYSEFQQTGEYILDQPVSGTGTYELRASAQGFESVIAETFVPDISSVNASVEYLEENDGVHDFTLSFTDDVNSNDYYQLIVVELWNGATSGNVIEFTTNESILISESNDVEFGSDYYFYLNGLFSDNLITSQNVSLSFSVQFWNEDSDYALQLVKCSRDYYLYTKSLLSYSGSDGFFTQPVQVYSNVEEGIGVFAGYNYVEIPLEF